MKVRVDQELVLATVPGGTWTLENTGGVHFNLGWTEWKVPYGFETDLNSGHFLPESWHHRSRHAALLHDHMYREGTVSREEADRAFLAVLIHRGAKPWRARVMYWGVRAGGWMAWRKYRRGG